MTFVFDMPEVGEGVVEAEVTAWKIAVGELIRVDQPLCEVTTDKATLEISSPRAGKVLKLHATPGDMVRVHTPLVELDESATVASAPAPAPAAPVAAAQAPASAPASAPLAVAAPALSKPVPPPVVSSTEASGPAKAAPAVRRRARELDIDVQAVAGSGPGGRVTQADLDSFHAPAPASAPLPLVARALPQVVPAAEDQVVKILGIRRKIAERMVQAKQTAPHYTYVEEIDCTRLVQLRERFKGRAAERGVKLTFLPFFAKACSIAFRDFPNVNAWMDSEKSELVVKAAHHLGIACDTPNGLMVPVVRDCQAKGILQIAADIEGVTSRARAGKSPREELSGSTFTLTGVGNIGGILATPILNLPEVGILGVNQIRKRAVVLEDDSIGVRHMTLLSPSFDHRIIDGAVGARFTARLKVILEDPELHFLELV